MCAVDSQASVQEVVGHYSVGTLRSWLARRLCTQQGGSEVISVLLVLSTDEDAFFSKGKPNLSIGRLDAIISDDLFVYRVQVSFSLA